MNKTNFSAFTKTRITLTLWYSLMLFIILVSFSFFIYTLQTQDVTRVVLQRDYGTHLPKKLSTTEKREIILQINELKKSFIINLILVDDFILLIGGGLSYLLAGKTLKPIQKTMQRQKEFIADASHELRTPLAVIQTASEIALRGKAKTKEDYKKVIDQTYRESSRMARMVEELFLLSRADAENANFQFENFYLDRLVKEIADETKPMFFQKKLRFINIAKDKVIIKGDRNRIKQLVLIILDNAIKFTPEGGTVSIKTGKSAKPFISIADTGIGIPKADQKKIFYRFFQVDKSRSERGEGLGLSIAKSIADSHNAKISVKSALEKGTEFKVIFNS